MPCLVPSYRWFDFIDTDKSGEISAEELQDPLIAIGVAKDRDAVRALIAKVDKDGSGEIGFQEFVDVVEGKYDQKGTPNPISRLYTALSAGSLGQGANDADFNLSRCVSRARLLFRPRDEGG